MKNLGFASIPAVLQYLRYAKSRGIDTDIPTAQAGISKALLTNENGRILGKQFQALIASLISISKDPLLGLNSSQFVQTSSYSVLGHIALSCSTIGEVIKRIPPFEKLVGDMGVTTIHHDHEYVELTWHCAYTDKTVRPHMIDNVLASWTQYARWLANRPAAAEIILLSKPEPDISLKQKYEHFFKCPVLFGQDRDAIRLPIELLDLKLRQPDLDLLRSFELQALAQITDIQQDEDTSEFTAMVIHAIRSQLMLGIAKKDLIAKEMHCTERTLQRRLAKEGQSYQSLLDRVRLDNADKLLRHSTLSIEEIAFNLGFNDARPFHRRFKLWTGESPGAYRRRVRQKHD